MNCDNTGLITSIPGCPTVTISSQLLNHLFIRALRPGAVLTCNWKWIATKVGYEHKGLSIKCLLDKNNHTFQTNLIESPLVYSKRVIKKISVTGGSLSLIEICFECS